MGLRISQNQGLQAASLIAQGAEKFMTAYQGQQARQSAAAMRMAEFQAENELRRMQMEKLRQETAPVQFNLQKMNLLLQGVDQGVVPDSIYNKQMSNFVDSIDSPAKLRVAQNALQQNAANKAVSMAPYAPGQEPSTIQQDQKIVSMSPNEAEFFGKMISARGQIAATGQRREAAQMGFEADMAKIAGEMSRATTKQEFDAAQNAFQRAMEIQKSKIAAGATVKAAEIRSTGKGAVKNPEAENLRKQILEIEKQRAKVIGRTPGITELPGQKADDVAALDARKTEIEQRLNSLSAPQAKAAAPSAAPAAKAPAPKASEKQIQKFTKGPGVSAKIAALPDGTEFEVDGKKYVKQGNAAVPR